MSKNATLHATKRDTSGTSEAKRLRRDGIVPAVVYGARQDHYSIQLPAKEIGELLHGAAGNVLVNLQIEGAKEKEKLAIIKDVQHNPLTGAIMHVDFHAVRADEDVNANVPVLLTGSAAGVKHGGMLEQQLHAIEVRCKPADLPAQVEVDVSDLEVGDAVHVSDIVLPEGVAAELDGDVVVAIVQEIRVLITEEPEEAVEEGEEGEEGEEAAEGAAEEGAAEEGARQPEAPADAS